MRPALFAAPIFSILIFSLTAKAQPLAITDLLKKTDMVAVCKTDNENLDLIKFYVHKTNPMIVAQLKNDNQDNFYSLTLEESKDLITLTTDKEILAIDFDLWFKTPDSKFTAHFDKETIYNPERKHFFSTLHFENGTTIDLACKRVE
ncbi:hypothetical protein [Bdellovibrio svalbardensis]|uniref:Uncharacterized protein n=1 Tax=Bdellovibrio svalbardensis TaxID=2972972 RepID=A0ABT6DNK4_9BACT|nr:hypothetical protein [Bdellovibrio svalbardensis]MDG0818214.1 hypothetical protein [Bdellovibrio svalbardensis]